MIFDCIACGLRALLALKLIESGVAKAPWFVDPLRDLFDSFLFVRGLLINDCLGLARRAAMSGLLGWLGCGARRRVWVNCDYYMW